MALNLEGLRGVRGVEGGSEGHGCGLAAIHVPFSRLGMTSASSLASSVVSSVRSAVFAICPFAAVESNFLRKSAAVLFAPFLPFAALLSLALAAVSLMFAASSSLSWASGSS